MEEPDNDWRMQDVLQLGENFEFPWTGQIALKGSQLTQHSITQLNKKKQLSIALPNATALCMSSSRRAWEEAQEIRKYSKIESPKGSRCCTLDEYLVRSNLNVFTSVS